MVKLKAKPGSWGKQDLYLPINDPENGNEVILLVRYPEGDCDCINWPFEGKDRRNLASALFDEYEMGFLKERTVLLPDGTEFNIDSVLANYCSYCGGVIHDYDANMHESGVCEGGAG